MNSIAVIPSFAIYGPIAILALLVPAVFGGLTIWYRRWSRAFAALSVMSAFSFAYAILPRHHLRSPTDGRVALWVLLTITALGFAILAVARQRRHRSAVQRSDRVVIGIAAIVFATLATWCVATGGRPSGFPSQELIVLTSASAAALIVLCVARLDAGSSISAEFVWLVALLAGCGSAAVEQVVQRRTPRAERLVWQIQLDGPGMIAAAPLVAGESIVVAVAHSSGFQAHGAIYSFDRSSGARQWSFGNGQLLKPVFSSPCFADGRLYFGEGLHSDKDCKLYCLDAANGTKLWEFATASHIESSPVVADGRVYFGAGDDGLHCLDATTGQAIWRYQGLHVDANPAIHEGRVYAGSTRAGDSGAAIFALDEVTGRQNWRVPTDLSSFARPSVWKGEVFFGLHNGDFVTPAAKPAGAVVSLDRETGRRNWRTDLPDAVFTQPLVDRDAVVVGCRDGQVYSLNRGDGSIRWKTPMGSPVLASPAGIANDDRLTAIYAAGRDGLLARLDPGTGRIIWSIDVLRDSELPGGQMLAAPVVVQEPAGRRIIMAVGTADGFSGPARVYCFSDDD